MLSCSVYVNTHTVLTDVPQVKAGCSSGAVEGPAVLTQRGTSSFQKKCRYQVLQ